MKYKCAKCGAIHDNPDSCPYCGADAEFQVHYEGKEGSVSDLKWDSSHSIGHIKGVPADIHKKIESCVEAEGFEAGLYLAMARQAEREGYGEIGLIFRNIAKDEAHHSSLFIESLGKNISTSTEENLKKVIRGENGACKIRSEIAIWAKNNAYDALHDLMHEAARDEHRHGVTFAGLLKRYFKK